MSNGNGRTDGPLAGRGQPDEPPPASRTEVFGTLADGRPVHRHLLGEPGGVQIAVLDHGATIQGIWLSDARGGTTNVVLSAADLDGYFRHHSDYYGAAVGRFANRIADGRFGVDGVEYQVVRNDGPHCLHGGPDGFHRRLWDIDHADARRIDLSLTSADGDQGFPGELTVGLTYSVSRDTVSIRFVATTTAPTVVNLTQHAHFNLDGEGSGSIDDHTLQVVAGRYLPVGADLIPTGEFADVAGTPFDFRRPHALGDRMTASHPQVAIAGGIDHNFVLDRSDDRPAAVLESARTGRRLEVVTDQPGLQVYSGNFFDGSHTGPSGRPYERGSGIALETQGFPDAPNRSGPEWPSVRLDPGDRLETTTTWRFTDTGGRT